jgi:hypothetical protein
MLVPLRPVDGVRVTTLIDNSSDALLPTKAWSAGGSERIGGPLPIMSVERH